VKRGPSQRPTEKRGGVGAFFERLAHAAIEWAGGSWAFGIAVVVIVTWALTGPVFGFSDTWQLVINTGTTIVTFLMVFLIQRAQNKESKAIQLKLNEIVAAVQGASNHLIDVEDLSEGEIEALRRHYRELAQLAGKSGSVLEAHSVEEARDRAEAKQKTGRRRTARA
jgi:low affinity Fe/Cu permease